MPLHIALDRDSEVPLYAQISRALRERILSGNLLAGLHLPPERRLAQELGVNRSTVLAAYRELKSEGLLDARVGRGTAVVGPRERAPRPAAGVAARGSDPRPLPWSELARPIAAKAEDPLLRDLLELTERRDAISLSIGLPAPELLPLGELHELERALFSAVGPAALQHSPTEGLTPFRESLARHMASRGAACSAPEVMVTSGSQQALDVVARAFVEPGDAVVVEAPSFFGALQVFRAAGARILGVPTDEHGMRTDALESLLERQRPKLVYTLPTFQNPSGSVMTLERRRHLLDLAYRFQVPVLEDDPYSDLRYDGETLPSVKALDEHGHVIYVSSFSKVLFPGLRIGWIAAPRPVVRRLALAKQSMDLHSSTLGQWLIDRFLRQGGLERHLRTARAAYAKRRDAMFEALRAEAPPGVTFARPEGGFYFWCQLPETIAPARLLSHAAEQRVSFLPGAPCFCEETGRNHVRLSFSAATPRRIREGVARFARALAAASRGARAGAAEVAGTAPIV
jgi:DNA-binding transcriptional MocR family regulator